MASAAVTQQESVAFFLIVLLAFQLTSLGPGVTSDECLPQSLS